MAALSALVTFAACHDGRPQHNAAIKLRLPLHLPLVAAICSCDRFGVAMLPSTVHLRLPLHLPADGSFLLL